ncbi:MAG: Ni/Fe hydrogenase subunit alpha [Candidatus Marinimicrobia bacterium]|nr:Ni/Fe hydrogenase subunit alpha [Candidatus Neomarinimicrobiota bacterium]
MKRIEIDPITRLEGHGKISIFLNDEGDVEKAFFQVPELRGFEEFCKGRLAEELARITPKICGVCPTAHHMASGKALDDLYKVEPPSAAKKIRELVNSAFMFEDHILHFFYLGGPDFLVGVDASKGERNILGVISKFGLEVATRLIETRKKVRSIITRQGGRVIHPVCNLPGGVSKGVSKEDKEDYIKIADEAIDFAIFALQTFKKVVLENKEYVELVLGDPYTMETYYMGMVDSNNRVNFYDGQIRVVGPDGKEFRKFEPRNYLEVIEERVEPWSYVKFTYLKDVGWKGFVTGKDSGIYRVAPLARLNVAEGMATPKAQEEYEEMFERLGGKPVHSTLAYHYARLVEALYAAERMKELAEDDEITSDDIRKIPTETPDEGIGIVEAPRGTLVHHYKTDNQGRVEEINLIVATLNNSASICISVEKAAREFIRKGKVTDGILNRVEMAFRAYDPCLACATHALPGQMPLVLTIYDSRNNVVDEIKRL